jgi:hypothetical protein
MTYEQFIESKRHSIQDFGIEAKYIPDTMFDYQGYVTNHMTRKGRYAGYLDTGTGKTFVELVIAYNYAVATNKRILIICPLAVAFQFIKEAAKFGFDDIEYSKEGKFTKKIVICNYERLHYFNESDFECVICDESSILKNAEGFTSASVTSFLRKIKYRFLFTATPSPNDYVELGTSSEALGYLGYVDMLTKFFTNNQDTISPMGIGVEWRLKGHAKKAFFEWVSSWSISMRKPSDLGFDDSRHILPELIVNDYYVENKKPLIINGQAQLFNIVAKTRSEIAAENRSTIFERCEKAAELASAHDTTVYWCNLNTEADLLAELDKNAVQVSGSMKLEKKEEILLAFSEGQIKKLITKARITAFGLNWQHCNHTVFFPGFSYEQYYQAIRRFWRFGQQREVYADRVTSDGQIRIIQALDAKAKKSDELFSELNANINRKYEVKKTAFDKEISIPSFLKQTK